MRSCGISETERVIDLHLHTTVSDGSYTPAELVRHAAELGLAAVAVTDHDAVAGCAEAAAVGESLGVEVVPGIEISTKYGGPVHLLGYYVDTASPALREVLDWIVHDRDERNKKIAAIMAAPVFLSFFLGALLWREAMKKAPCYWAELLLGVLLWRVAASVPVASFAVGLVTVPLGVGVLTLLLGKRRNRDTRFSQMLDAGTGDGV